MRPEDIIKNDTGMRMYNAVTPGIYNKDELQLSIFNANGLIMDEVLQAALKLHIESLVNNATWSLPYWEQMFRLKPTDNQTLEQRRRAVILKMNEYFPVTRRRMESIIDAFTQLGGTEIDDKRGDYIFRISLKNSGEIDLNSMIDAIEVTKPAHLDYRIAQESSNNYIYVGATAISGEQITIYPWTPKEIEIQTTYVFLGTTQSHEELTIYPKGG